MIANTALKELHNLEGHIDSVRSVSFSPNGKLIVSGSYDETVKTWDVETGKQVHNLEGHSSDVNSVSFSPNSRLIVSGSLDKTVKTWDVQTGKQLQSL